MENNFATHDTYINEENYLQVTASLKLTARDIFALQKLERDGIYDLAYSPDMASTVEGIVYEVLDLVREHSRASAKLQSGENNLSSVI